MQIYTLADITGTGARVALSATSQPCKWFQVTAVSIASQARMGDINVTSSRGIPILPAGGQFSPPIAAPLDLYDLSNCYIYLANGDSVSVAYAI
jgi:hypothetical protein